MSLSEVVRTGDRRASLEAVRDRLAVEIDSGRAEGRDVATLAKVLAETMRELDSLPVAGEVSPVDDLAAARTARRAAAQEPKRAAGGDKRRSGSGGTGRKRGSAS